MAVAELLLEGVGRATPGVASHLRPLDQESESEIWEVAVVPLEGAACADIAVEGARLLRTAGGWIDEPRVESKVVQDEVVHGPAVGLN